jgi:4-hydroxy-3-methylbut-2-enyl diphosphate reductase
MPQFRNPQGGTHMTSQETYTPPTTTDDMDFGSMLDESLTTLRSGHIVRGKVVRVTTTEVIVDLGYKSDGIITRSEFTTDASVVLTEAIKPGDELDVYVLRVNDGEGNVVCSKKKVDAMGNLKALEEAHENKTPVLGKVKELVKGGLIADVLGARAFIPASQISARYESDLEQYKGKEFYFLILEYDRNKRRIVAGRKELAAAEAQAKRDEIFDTLDLGTVMKGTVSRLVDFGAFVDLGGVDGLIHVSEITWKRIRRPHEVLKVGDAIEATVIGLDPDRGKISLTLKDINANPWNGIAEKFPVGSIVDGTVARIAPFGAFITLEEGIDGLVHISHVSHRRVAKAEDELSVGQEVQVMVLDIDLENQRISLSKKEADAVLYPEEYAQSDDE